MEDEEEVEENYEEEIKEEKKSETSLQFTSLIRRTSGCTIF